MISILVATTNKGKVRELTELVAGLKIRVITLDELLSVPPPPKETMNTFTGNALLKAEYYHRLTGMITIADDSGLEVDALGGRPGVWSAEYGGADLDSSERNSLLLEEMRAIPPGSRGARFVCVLAVAGAGICRTFTGSCEGEISVVPRGEGGFGYDPVFIDRESGLSFAVLSSAEKSRRSHRGRAAEGLRAFLREIAGESGEGLSRLPAQLPAQLPDGMVEAQSPVRGQG